jgi:diguanylate cyclase (GGDEF)-like protein
MPSPARPLTPHRDSYASLRDQLRWRMALVLGALIIVLMLALGITNTRMGYADTALLAWIVMGTGAVCLAGLLVLPRGLGGALFFAAIVLLLVVVMAYGLQHGRAMQHWAYILPPAIIFLLRAGPALVVMLLFGAYATACIVPVLPLIEVIRFAAGYGLLVCFMYTYALLQERAATMLRYHSDHDALSNCYNRRSFNEALEQVERSAGAGQPVAFLLMDIDHFKAINDGHGHLVGDRVITQTAATLMSLLDASMPLYRYGGEEFAVILPGVGATDAMRLAEALRATVAGADYQGVKVTISIGVAEWRAHRGGVAQAVGLADRALYAAKRAGRNRVMTSE